MIHRAKTRTMIRLGCLGIWFAPAVGGLTVAVFRSGLVSWWHSYGGIDAPALVSKLLGGQ